LKYHRNHRFRKPDEQQYSTEFQFNQVNFSRRAEMQLLALTLIVWLSLQTGLFGLCLNLSAMQKLSLTTINK